jgi:group II intron reverse transcriptase/maturase
MQTTETVLKAIHKSGVEGKPLERLYRQLYNRELYLTAYGKLYSNRGALTRGATNQTIDGMTQDRIDRMIEQLKFERFRWTPVRRTYIPKKDGSQRPLGIPTWEDKLLQEVMRMLLEAYYEPRFSESSHGFRPQRGCHTALQKIQSAWKGTTWFIEGDISKCFDSFNHDKLLEILEDNIKDGRFITLLRYLLKAGYMEEWQWKTTPSGTPQGGVISPLLANIYLNELDKFVEETLLPIHNTGIIRRSNPEYRHYARRKAKAKQENDREAFKTWDKQMRSVPASDTHDPNYRRLRYVRYADDFLLGFTGPKTEAEDIKGKLAEWIGNELKLELSQTKTAITHASTNSARFLGYDISIEKKDSYRDGSGSRNLNGCIVLYLPTDKLHAFINRYTSKGKPIHRKELTNNSDYDIVATYQAEYRGYVQYYQMAQNLYQMNKLYWIMSSSMLKTLAHKHKSSVQTMADRYKCIIKTEHGELTGFRVTVEREGKPPLITEFGGIHLTTNRTPSIIADKEWTVHTNHTELVQRLLADECEMCGSKENIEVHHVRKLADLTKEGRKEKPAWIQRMAALRRKTLVVCRICHDTIHAGNTRPEWNR